MTYRSVFILIALIILCITACGAVPTEATTPPYLPQEGDLVFQTSKSQQGPAIQIATQSVYSHVGVVYIQNGTPWVFEASSKVKLTPLKEWISRGDGGWYTVKRLKNAEKLLTPSARTSLKAVGQKFMGRPYDVLFEWSDNKIYCSELVWKLYQEGLGLELAPLRKMGEYSFDDPRVAGLVEKRWGHRFSADELVVAPSDLDTSPFLETIYSNY